MDSVKPLLPNISNEDRTPLVDVLLELLAWQDKRIDQMEQEILKLKGETIKPEVKPSKMEKDTAEDGDGAGNNTSKKKKGPKRSKTESLKIDTTIDIQPDKIPAGSTFKCYREVVIQDIKFETFNIYIPMTPVRVMMAKMVIAHLSAMNYLPGSVVPRVKAALIF